MRRLLLITFLLAGCATTATDPAAQRLETTPRHDEWVQLDRSGRTLHAYISYPERSSLTSAIVLIHENRGLNDWVRSLADQLSERGYLVIAPDLLSGAAPGGGRTKDFPTEDAAREAISALSKDQVMGDLEAAGDYIRKLPSSNGKVSVAGFCWGGARAWEFANATNVPLTATYVFYGTGPTEAAGVAGIDSPVYGFYGGNDARVNATIPKSAELMTAAGKRFEPVTYDGAGHAFLRAGSEPGSSRENKRAHDEAWKRWLALLKAHAQ
jgi:carboxymethylenebutenolidase